VAVWADVQVDSETTIRVYSAHTENLCGRIERLEQLCQIVKHARGTAPDFPCVIAGGLLYCCYYYYSYYYYYFFFLNY
jgi:endonuclease/exonuclease/phosphatase family metal-dependent hydrolase